MTPSRGLSRAASSAASLNSRRQALVASIARPTRARELFVGSTAALVSSSDAARPRRPVPWPASARADRRAISWSASTARPWAMGKKACPACRALSSPSSLLRYQSTVAASAPQTASADRPHDQSQEVKQPAKVENGEEGLIPRLDRRRSAGELKRLWRLVLPEKKTISIATALLVVSSTVSLSVPYTLGRIIDLFSGNNASELPISLPAAAGFLAGFFLVGAAANTGRSILMRIAGQRIVNTLRVNAYTSVMRQDMSWYDLQGQPGKAIEAPKDTPTQDASNAVKSTGDLISRLSSDTSVVGDSLTRELSEALRSLVTAIAGVSMMFYISAKLTFVMLAIVPPVAIGAVFYGRFLKQLSRKVQKATADMVATTEERIGGIRTVHAFNAVQPIETKRFQLRVDEIFNLAKLDAVWTGVFYGSAGFSGNIVLLALLSYGGTLVSRGEISVGDLSSLILYTAYVGGSMTSTVSFYAVIMKGLGAAGRVFELLDAQPASVVLDQGAILPSNEPPRPLSFRDVKFAYPSRPGTEVLKGIDLTIEPGTSVAIAGGSGSGKSTLGNLLLRFYDPLSGIITYGKDDVRSLTPQSWRSVISIVPQDPYLFSDTIANNIAYGCPSATLNEIKAAAELANCDFIETLPQGFKTQVGARAAQLSGGQRQRLAIARALVRKPKILILDEATSALDASSETLVNDAIARITADLGLTTILIAHRLSTLRTADK
ncbi:uncharacterized protein L969DRAFT_82836 [Mixia osmundae IAM 14324]|nr:uncharacterized protein L969DRAFT_82836 [Mixia osmundae IAM 14324]KEI37967.1 hypothetical protein L969DRAFT_82836 [Mixia osmundae IAM 14324]